MKKIKSFISRYWIVLFITAGVLVSSYNNEVYLKKSIKITVTELPILAEKIRVIDAAGLAAIFETTADIFVVVDRATTIAAGTLPFPPTPIDGQIMSISTRVAITALTLNTNAIPISGSISTLAAGAAAGWCYDLASNRWFRMP